MLRHFGIQLLKLVLVTTRSRFTIKKNWHILAVELKTVDHGL